MFLGDVGQSPPRRGHESAFSRKTVLSPEAAVGWNMCHLPDKRYAWLKGRAVPGQRTSLP